MAGRIFIFANPISGRGRGQRLARRLHGELAWARYEVDLFVQHPSQVQKTSAIIDVEAVICIGGDGSLRAVADWLLRQTFNPPPILIIPMGTANLMGQHLGVRWAPRSVVPAVLATLEGRRIARIDAARANGELFLLIAGIGFDAQVVHLLDRLRRGPINLLSYVLPAAAALVDYRFPAIRVAVDGQPVFREQPGIAFIGNVSEYGLGVPILTRAVPNDGLLDICIMPCRDLRDLVELLALVVLGEHLNRDDVLYLRGKSIVVESTAAVPVQLDGDSAGHTPVGIELAGEQVSFFIPV